MSCAAGAETIDITQFVAERVSATLPDKACLSHEFPKKLGHLPIHVAAERHDEIGDTVEPLPSPLVEFRRLAVAWRERIDLIVASSEAQREPFLPLATEFCQPMRRRPGERWKVVSQPIGLAEIVCVCHACLFPEFAHDRIPRVFAGVDAALWHLPLQARKNDFRSVVAEAPPDQNLTGRVEQGDAHIRAIGFGVRHKSNGRHSPMVRRTDQTSDVHCTPGGIARFAIRCFTGAFSDKRYALPGE